MRWDNRRSRRARVRTGMATFVLAATLIPIATMGYYVGGDVVAADRARRDASAALAQSHELAAVTEAMTAYCREILTSYLAVGAKLFNLSPLALSMILGVDASKAMADARARLDRALGAVPPDFPLHHLGPALVALRPRIDEGLATPDEFAAATEDAGKQVRIALLDRLDRLRSEIAASAAEPGVIGAIDDLALMVSMVDAIAGQNSVLLALQGGVQDAAGTDQVAVIVRRNDEYRRLVDEVARRGTPTVQAHWRAFAASEANTSTLAELARTEARALAGDLTRPPLLQLGGVLRQVNVRMDDAIRLVEQSNGDTVAAATAGHARAASAASRSLAAAAAASMASIVAVVLVKRRIVGPLRSLERASTTVQLGDLPDAPLRVTGPREVAVATAAFNGLITTLDTISQQAEALARGALDAAVLDLPAPGRLGASIQGSVERLQSSITAQNALHTQLAHDATHDRLTALANRSAATAALDAHLRTGEPLAVALVALDGFKATNDALGHAVGDRALANLAQRLASRLASPAGGRPASGHTGGRGPCVVARWSGDEFLVLAPGPSDHDAAALGQLLIDTVEGPLDVGTSVVRLGASVGVVPPSAGLGSSAEVLRAANAATRRAKASGRGMLQLFDATARADLARIDALGVRLRDALAADELCLHYQPLVETTTGRLTEVEALIRWFPSDGTTISPAEFLPVAEATGLSAELDEWVVRQAASQLAAWRDEPLLCNVAMAVNLTAASALSHGIAERLLSWLWWADADHTKLIVEVNEDTFIASFASMGERLAALRQAGVRIAVDDFGTGLTSIGQLRAMPVDILKLDRSLVAGNSAADRGVLQAVVDLGRALDLEMVAEGVETAEQASTLTELGCHRLQGWLYAPALCPAELTAWAQCRAGSPSRAGA